MKRIGTFAIAACALALGLAASAHAQTPNPNGVWYKLRIFNDCPAATVTTGGSYPSSFYIDESVLPCVGYANFDEWSFSEDGGASECLFGNNANFSFCADLVISGAGTHGEAGLGIRPWYSGDDGFFNVRSTTPDGEVACFGGRLPFFSFTAAPLNVHYIQGDPIHLAMTYISGPTGPSAAHPATIKYDLVYGGTPYSSGPLAFDEGNPSEDPPHGLWGILNAARAGGHLKAYVVPGDFNTSLRATWSNVCYSNLQTVPTKSTTWGALKSLYR